MAVHHDACTAGMTYFRRARASLYPPTLGQAAPKNSPWLMLTRTLAHRNWFDTVVVGISVGMLALSTGGNGCSPYHIVLTLYFTAHVHTALHKYLKILSFRRHRPGL
jgi:hypothetical protein